MGQNYSISLDLASYGKVTAEVEYYIGHHGSYWEPPESDEVCVKSIQNQNGIHFFPDKSARPSINCTAGASTSAV